MAALAAMISGGSTTVCLAVLAQNGSVDLPLGLDANVFGLLVSAAAFFVVRTAVMHRKRSA